MIRDFKWMEDHINGATAAVASWPAWKRGTMTDPTICIRCGRSQQAHTWNDRDVCNMFIGPTDPEKAYDRLLKAFGELQAAAWKVIHETDKNLDTKPSPQKYGAAYGALGELRTLLARQQGLR